MLKLRCEDLFEIDQALSKPAVYNYTDRSGTTGFVIYQPVQGYQDEHGTVVAHLVAWNSEDDELTTSLYYSRGWAYWNFQDVLGDDFALANDAMQLEAVNGPIDYEIGEMVEAVASITNNTIPHNNPYWKSLVVRTAYDAITNVEEFANICRNSQYTQEQVQRMIDLAVGAVLSNDRFTITGVDTQTA
jgi:hypothetical protein